MKIQFVDSNNDYFDKTSYDMNMPDTDYQTASCSNFFRNSTGNKQKSIVTNYYYKL